MSLEYAAQRLNYIDKSPSEPTGAMARWSFFATVAASGAVASGSPALAAPTAPTGLADAALQGAVSTLQADHLAFVAGAGAVAAMTGLPFFAPIALVGAALAGAVAQAAGIQFAFVEAACALTATLVGVLLLIRGPFPAGVTLVTFIFAGLFHGFRLSAATTEWSATWTAAHAVGLATAQYAMVAAVAVVVSLGAEGPAGRTAQRVVGGALMFFGLARTALVAGLAP
ncbi:MAG: hypothetical protein EA355_15020 [Rhodobacteraceae bacterium]|nr:MAG: hypothetical protein EA355_15020 [Paracoccaceae bacterium]